MVNAASIARASSPPQPSARRNAAEPRNPNGTHGSPRVGWPNGSESRNPPFSVIASAMRMCQPRPGSSTMPEPARCRIASAKKTNTKSATPTRGKLRRAGGLASAVMESRQWVEGAPESCETLVHRRGGVKPAGDRRPPEGDGSKRWAVAEALFLFLRVLQAPALALGLLLALLGPLEVPGDQPDHGQKEQEEGGCPEGDRVALGQCLEVAGEHVAAHGRSFGRR